MLPVDSVAMPDSDWYRLQRIIAGFETAWKRGDRPEIAGCLSFDEPHREQLLIELVHAEMEFRLKAGEAARVEEYLRKFPELSRDRLTVLALIKTEWSFRRQREPKLALESYCERFPGLREDLEASRSNASTVNSLQSSSRTESKTLAVVEPPLPRRLGKFELREKLGTGSFGVVYRAWDTLLKRQVAVKIPRPEAMAAEPDLQGFVREARNAIHLQHPNIVAIFDASPIEDTVCVVRAFVEGSTLADLIRDESFKPNESAALMAIVADALDYAHGRGIIHRDLKPANILLDLDGQPLVSDFGLAKCESSDTTLTPGGLSSGVLIGTPAYMSPEQARGEGSLVDARSDVFSAGIVLYELLTGSLPFRGRGKMLQLQIQELTPTAPRSLNEDVPPGLETICLKALAKDPADRYQSAKALADDLRKFLGGESIAPIEEGPSKPESLPGRQKRALVVVSVVLCLGLIGMTFLWLNAEMRLARERERHDRAIRARVEFANPLDR